MTIILKIRPCMRFRGARDRVNHFDSVFLGVRSIDKMVGFL